MFSLWLRLSPSRRSRRPASIWDFAMPLRWLPMESPEPMPSSVVWIAAIESLSLDSWRFEGGRRVDFTGVLDLLTTSLPSPLFFFFFLPFPYEPLPSSLLDLVSRFWLSNALEFKLRLWACCFNSLSSKSFFIFAKFGLFYLLLLDFYTIEGGDAWLLF